MRGAQTALTAIRRIRDGLVAIISSPLTSPPPGLDVDTEEKLYRRAEEIEYETDLSSRESVVLAGDEMGLSDKQIALAIGRGRDTVRRVKYDLRRRRRQIAEEIETIEATKETLGDEA